MDIDWDIRIFLPVLGSLTLLLTALFTHKNYRQVGIIHVIERLDWHQARLSLGNLLNQFFAGAIAIASGHSIGREGPAVHLGAGTASLLGQSMKLPNNSLRILVACGSAAAISAAFNTPVAGVIFSLEVLMVEYTLSGFLPVMLASASAAIITQTIYGTDPAFLVPPISTELLSDLPLILTTGVVMGVLGALFCQLMTFFVKKTARVPLFLRLLTAAGVTGLIAIPAPAVMGVGYGTITELMIGELHTPLFLVLILFGKLLASSISLGLGVPGGLIGPTLFIGAAGGALCATVMGLLTGTEYMNAGFHVMVGMSAMLGSVLQAPLTALVTVVEMTRNTNLLFPALLAIIIATLTANLMFRKPGIFEQLLGLQGRSRFHNPVHKALSRIGITSMMDTEFIRLNRFQSLAELSSLLKNNPTWILILENGAPSMIMPTSGLVFYLDNNNDSSDTVDLLDIPASRYDVAPIESQSSVYQAWEMMAEKHVDALYIFSEKRKKKQKIIGLVTKENLVSHYRI
nr:chloride channel protein [Sansalvadorimonas sp. 2012CJ34-2]